MKIKDKNNLTQWKKRVLCFRFIYSILINNLDNNEISQKYHDEIKLLNDAYIKKILTVFLLEKENIILSIKNKLNENWSIERINVVDLSIIIQSICEFIAHKIDKKIIIDQAIISSKKYSDLKSYKFVNSILDKILK